MSMLCDAWLCVVMQEAGEYDELCLLTFPHLGNKIPAAGRMRQMHNQYDQLDSDRIIIRMASYRLAAQMRNADAKEAVLWICMSSDIHLVTSTPR